MTSADTEVEADPRRALVEQSQQEGRFPGLVAAMSRAGHVDWRFTLGETAAAYRVASITKTFTAAAVMQLRDAGRIELDDRLGDHLSDVRYADATIRRLLAHSSGMTAEPTGPWWERVPGGSWDQLMAANPENQVFAPGRRHHYSNLGYALLGRLVEQVHTAPWWDVVTDRILRPLRLDHTTFEHPPDAAIGTSRNPLTGELVREPSEDEGAMAPAGQLWSTTDDLLRWVDVLAAGHPEVLSADTAAEMRTVQAADPETQHRGGYGLGVRLHWSPFGTVVGHTGSLPGFMAGMFADPVSRVGAVVLTNATTGLDPEGLCTGLIEAARPEVTDDPVSADPSSPAADLGGSWYWGNTAFEVVPTAEGFVLVAGPNRTRFRSEDQEGYRGESSYLAGERLDVHRRPDGSPSHLLAASFLFTRTPYDPQTPIPGRLPEPL